EIVGEHAAKEPAQAPAEHGDGDDGAGIGGNELVLRGGEQLAQRHADGEDEREDFEAVEGPAEIGGDERLPLRAVERAVPGRGRGGGGIAPSLSPSNFF